MVFTHAYIITWKMLGTPLADDNIPGNSLLPAEDLHPQAFTF
jgi:hypothetical protein